MLVRRVHRVVVAFLPCVGAGAGDNPVQFSAV